MWAIRTVLLLVSGLLMTTGVAQQFFSEEPTNVTVPRGDYADFHCRSVYLTSWQVNGTSIDRESIGAITVSNNGSLSTLSIFARDVYNGIPVVCVAHVPAPDSAASVPSRAAQPLIQGPLPSVVVNTPIVNISGIFINWHPPISLDLTYSVVDIFYQVEVCRLDGSEVRNCSNETVSQPEYSYSTEETNHLLLFTATPLSPRRDGSYLEGNSSDPVPAHFLGAPNDIETVTSRNPLNVDLLISRTAAPGRVPVPTYCIHGETIGPGPTLVLECDDTTGTEEGDFVVLRLSCRYLLPDRIYNITVEAVNNAGSVNTTGIILSTHDVTHVQINNTSNPGIVNISCTFASGTDAKGCFAILYPMSEHPVVYGAAMRSGDTANITVQGLTDGSYVVVVFDIDPSGLPESLAAALPQRVDGVGGERVDMTNTMSPVVSVSISGLDVCVTAGMDGVAIIHSTNDTDQQSLFAVEVIGGRMACSTDLNEGDYHVAVFDGSIIGSPVHTEVVTVRAHPTLESAAALPPDVSETVNYGLIIGVPLSIVIGVSLMVLVLVLTVYCHRKKSRKQLRDAVSSLPSVSYNKCQESTQLLKRKNSMQGASVNGDSEAAGKISHGKYDQLQKDAEPVVKTSVGDATPGLTYDVPKVKTAVQNTEHEPGLCSTVNGAHVAESSSVAPHREGMSKLSQPLTQEAVFRKISIAASKWKAIAQQMNISERLQDEINASKKCDEDCLDEVVRCWLENSEFSHTWAELADAVEGAGQTELSEQIRAEIDRCASYRRESSGNCSNLLPARLSPTEGGLYQLMHPLYIVKSDKGSNGDSSATIEESGDRAQCCEGGVVSSEGPFENDSGVNPTGQSPVTEERSVESTASCFNVLKQLHSTPLSLVTPTTRVHAAAPLPPEHVDAMAPEHTLNPFSGNADRVSPTVTVSPVIHKEPHTTVPLC